MEAAVITALTDVTEIGATPGSTASAAACSPEADVRAPTAAASESLREIRRRTWNSWNS
jgi:hypothetical protein